MNISCYQWSDTHCGWPWPGYENSIKQTFTSLILLNWCKNFWSIENGWVSYCCRWQDTYWPTTMIKFMIMHDNDDNDANYGLGVSLLGWVQQQQMMMTAWHTTKYQLNCVEQTLCDSLWPHQLSSSSFTHQPTIMNGIYASARVESFLITTWKSLPEMSQSSRR